MNKQSAMHIMGSICVKNVQKNIKLNDNMLKTIELCEKYLKTY